MGIYAPVAGGLSKNHTPAELTPGETFIVRFKNPRLNYRTDIWFGVILTDDFGPGKYLNGRPNKAKQSDGTWTAALNERVYPVYFAGKNSFRWVSIQDMFDLGAEVPSQFSRSSDRDDAGVFRDLQKIALQGPDCQFWESMAEKELQFKGRKCRDPSLVLPDGYEDILIGMDDALEDVSMTGPSELDGAPVASSSGSRSSIVSSPSASQACQSLSFPGGSLVFQDYSAGNQRSTETTQAVTPFKAKAAETQVAGPSRAQPVKVEARSPDMSAERPRPTRRMRKSIYQVTLAEMIDRILHESPEAEELGTIVTALLEVRSKPESAKIKSFDNSGEFVPRIVQILNNPSTENTKENSKQSQEYQLGDCNGLKRSYQLEGINDSHMLQNEIRSLGVLYTYARRFNKPALMNMITNKLQIAWNSYPGLCQLEPILDVAIMACQDGFNAEKKDALQEWILKFIADTKDLFPVACNTKYWMVMRELPVLIDAVNEKRDELVRQFPGRYSDVRVLLHERGVERF